MLKGFGLFLLIAGLLGVGSYYVVINGMSYADMARLAFDKGALSVLPVWFYGSIAAAIAGFVMWMIGIVVQAIERSSSDGWWHRRIAGRNVQYRKRNGSHEVRLDGSERSFETFEQLVEHVSVR